MSKMLTTNQLLTRYALTGGAIGLYFGFFFRPARQPSLIFVLGLALLITLVTVLIKVFKQRPSLQTLLKAAFLTFLKAVLFLILLELRHPERLHHVMEQTLQPAQIARDSDLSVDQLQTLVGRYQEIVFGELRQIVPVVDPAAETVVLAQGLPASPGAASGRVVFTADEAEELAAAGEEIILVRQETNPDGLHRLVAANAVIPSKRW